MLMLSGHGAGIVVSEATGAGTVPWSRRMGVIHGDGSRLRLDAEGLRGRMTC